MTRDEAGRLQEFWKANYGDKPCSHSRLVEYLTSETGDNTRGCICRECGTIFEDPFKTCLSK